MRMLLMAVLVLTGTTCATAGQEITLLQCGGVTRLHTGDSLLVRLESQVTNGYLWRVASQTTGILRLAGEPVTQWADGRSDIDGGSEVQVFRFDAIGVGDEQVIFHSSHPWVKDAPPRKTCTISVTVAEDP